MILDGVLLSFDGRSILNCSRHLNLKFCALKREHKQVNLNFDENYLSYTVVYLFIKTTFTIYKEMYIYNIMQSISVIVVTAQRLLYDSNNPTSNYK